MKIRTYCPETDRTAVARIWREVGWLGSAEAEKAFSIYLEAGRSFVGEWNGEAECMTNVLPGTIRHLEEEIPLACVSGVTTSRIARRRGLAKHVTAHALAEAAAEGADVAMLGVFDQGFYNQLGFGNGGYEHWFSLDPAQLMVDSATRTPVRLGANDWRAVHDSRRNRLRHHGAATVLCGELTHAEMLWSKNGFGLGYYDETGELTHHLWCIPGEKSHGPYRISWLSYRERQELLELLALLRDLSDQVHLIRMQEPAHIQLQDLLRKPTKGRVVTQGSEYEQRISASAYLQVRILDLVRCLARTRLPVEALAFNLILDDPIATVLPGEAPWRGIAGRYVITLGSPCRARPGIDASLMTLRASVNAFSRLWLGVRPASSLSWTDALAGPEALLADLDRALRLPRPTSDWDF